MWTVLQISGKSMVFAINNDGPLDTHMERRALTPTTRFTGINLQSITEINVNAKTIELLQQVRMS